MDQYEADVKQTKIITIGLACVAFTLITGISSCLMHDKALNAVNVKANAEYLKVQTSQEKEHSDAIKILISGGTNPVVARCAIIGWKSERDAIVCASAGDKNPNTTGKSTD